MHTGTGLASAWGAAVEERGSRLLLRAALCSLVLHALILFFLPYFKEFRQSRVAPPPLTAHLAKPKPPDPPKAEPPPPLTRSPVVRPAAKPQQPAAARPVPPAATPVMSVEPQKQAAEPVLVAPAAPPPVARTEVQPVPAATGPDPGTVARFRLELMEIARRYKRYPRIAQDNNWEGRVELRIAFAESGAISSMTVKKGTGRSVLDEQAQAMIRSAHPQVDIPPALRGKAFVLEIPVDFSLKDER